MITKNFFTAAQLEELADVIINSGSVEQAIETPISRAFIDKTYSELQTSIKTTKKDEKADSFDSNIKAFSYSKQATIISDHIGLSGLTEDEKDEFIGRLDTLHNIHLGTEKRTAKMQAASVEQWREISEQKNVLPYLEYLTSDDSKVREAHKVLDGIVRPVDDKFWATFYPPLDYNCRCDVNQIEEPGDSIAGREDQTFDRAEAMEGVSAGLAHNSAISGEIFSKEHPYFNG